MTSILSCQQRRAIFHTLFNHSAVSISAALSDGTIVMANGAFCDFVGYSEEELLRLNLLDLTFADDRELTKRQFRQGAKEECVFHYEKRYVRKDGRIVWGLASGAWTTDSAGNAYAIALIQDITSRKESESALQQSEQLYRTLVESSHFLINLIGEDRRILKVNGAAARLFGRAAESFIGKECFREFEKRDRVCEHCPGTESLATGKQASVVTEGVKDDGTPIVVRLHTFPVIDPDGRARKFVEIVEDITDQMGMRDALRESEARYRNLFEVNPLPMWIFDVESLRFLAVNEAAVAHYGYSRKEFLAMTIKEIRPPEDLPYLLDCLGKQSEGHQQFYARHSRKDGSHIEVEVHAHDLDYGGRRARVVVIHDVTQKRRAEERTRLDAAALMSTRDAVLIVDRTPRIISVNLAFTTMTGFSESEIIGEHPRILSSGRQNRAVFEDISSTLLQESQWQGEFWGRRKDGETFPGWLSLSTVLNSEGVPSHFVGVITDLTRLKQSEEKLHFLANYDALTELPKRHLLESMLQHALDRSRRDGRIVPLMLIDIDQFGVVNQTFGHKVGDELLRSVSQRLKERTRGEDTLSRLTGDRFALILEGSRDYTDIEVVARDLQDLMAIPFFLKDDQAVELRISIGISISPQDGISAQELLCGADAAVNLAKQKGGNQFCYYTAELNAQARMRMGLQTALRQAIDRNEFHLHYQPIVDLRSGRIIAGEALIRWSSPSLGVIQPLDFIPLAEKNGLIIPIGAWVLDTVCRQIRQWHDAGLGEIRISVNVSARQFRSNLEEQVCTALQRHGLKPQSLTLELTESMVMDDPEDATARIAALRRLGVRISLDDFGTGYSSLGYLGNFPIDTLKIDRSFVKEIVTDPKSAVISTSVIALAHRMRLKVIAEGVETEAQLGYLRQNGCDEMQGFFFSKPLPPEAFAELLRQGKTLPPPQESPESASLLIVDDEPHILSALRRLLFDEGYRIFTAESAREGLELLAQNEVQVIITDQRMPNMCGTEFLKRVKAVHPNTVRLVLSGYADLPTVTEAVNEGALYKFLVKPWNDDELLGQIRDAFLYYETEIRPRRLACGPC